MQQTATKGLEIIMCEKRLDRQGLLSLEKILLRENLTAIYNYPMEA